jgi:N-acylethanolamine-hydrolysing acid amidase
VVVDLDKAPAERWDFLAHDPAFTNFKQDFISYLADYIPKAAIPLITEIASGLKRSFYEDYGEEMAGIAKALNMSLGDIVATNIIYQLEDIGVKCDKRNTTGPCPPTQKNSPGLCTGVVADDGEKVWEGRNLDWNLDANLLKYVLQVEYRKSNRTVFVGAQITGMIGVLHGLTQQGGFSGQINARETGGNVLENLGELVLGARTPSHVLRRALETKADFDGALAFLSSERLANPVYYVVAGAAHRSGAILSRDRHGLVDAWHLYEAPSKDTNKTNVQPDWFRLQTNYDHWEVVPAYDDRRGPGVSHMKEDCADSVGQDCIWKVISTWPTKNHHTDISAVMCPKTGYFDMKVWTEPALPIMV